MSVIAHAGHWALDALELAPLVAVLAALGWKVQSDRLRRRREATSAGAH